MINKIAIVWESEEGGGVNSYLKYLLSSKSFREKEITIITNVNNSGHKFLEKDFKKFKNIRFEFFSSFFVRKRNIIIKILLYFFKPLFLLITIFNLKRILNKDYDLLLCQCGNYGTFRSEQAAIFAAKLLKIPLRFLVIHHACEKPQKFLEIFHYLTNIFLRNSASGLITVSNATLKTVKKNSNILRKNCLKTKIIHNGVPKFKENRILKKYRNIRVIMMSRLVQNKGHEILLESLKKLPYKNLKKFVFDIIGEGSERYKAKLQKLIKESKLCNYVKIQGFKTGNSQNIISKYDLFISLTKDYEGFGLSIAEAMSSNVPVIATNVGAVSEFCNNENSTLIKPNSAKDLTKSLNDFIKKKIEFKKKSKKAQDEIHMYFNNELMGKKYFQFFNNIKYN